MNWRVEAHINDSWYEVAERTSYAQAEEVARYMGDALKVRLRKVL